MRQPDEQAPVGFAPDQAILLQQAYAFAHRGAVDVELLHQLGLDADGFSGPDTAGKNPPLDGFSDQLAGRR